MTKKAIGSYVDEELWDVLKDHAADTGLPITRIIEDALRAYLNVPRKTAKGRK